MTEQWKEIEGFSRYKVSPEGEVLDTKTGKLVAKQLTGKPQYYYVNMNRDDGQRKLKRVHRFVAEAYVEGRSEEFDIVDHIDRDKFNNHYTNLRWVNHSGNQRNREGNIYIFGEAVKDYSQRYENPEAAYTYLAICLSQGMSDQEAVDKYQENLDYGLKRIVVEWDGENVYLVDLCEKYNKDYFEVNARLRKGWDIWNAIYNIYPGQPYSLQVPCELVTGHWFPSKKYLGEYFGNLGDKITDIAVQGCTYQQLKSYDKLDHLRKTVLGVTGTVSEICKHFGLDEGTVTSRMRRKGITFEEALTPEKERIKYVELNGERITTKKLWEYFGLNAKACNKKRSKTGLSIEDTLRQYGVDLDTISLKY
jgi:hypothetical protein